MQFHLVNKFGQSYFEGQTFATREAALAAAAEIIPTADHGVWLASDDENDVGEELHAAQ